MQTLSVIFWGFGKLVSVSGVMLDSIVVRNASESAGGLAHVGFDCSVGANSCYHTPR